MLQHRLSEHTLRYFNIYFAQSLDITRLRFPPTFQHTPLKLTPSNSVLRDGKVLLNYPHLDFTKNRERVRIGNFNDIHLYPSQSIDAYGHI